LKTNIIQKVLLTIAILLPTIGWSQQSNPLPANDPIVEALDSLVKLNNVLRFNSSSVKAVNTSDRSVPVYSEEVYKARMARMSSPIPMVYNDQVRNYIDLYAYKMRGHTSRVLGLSELYFPLFEEALDKEGLPMELKYLAIVESALNPIAVSRAGATGLWQFMYNTGKGYNLTINSFIDERRDPIKSTYAACKYFKDMYAIYGDWLLVIASYNCGPGNVNKAIRRAGGKTNFWEISQYLPAETRGYVPAFIAVTYVMNHSSEHNIFAVQPAFNYFEVDTLAIEKQISLKKISETIGLPYDVITYLNPVYKSGVIPQYGGPGILRLPTNYVPAFIAAEPTLFPTVDPATASTDGVKKNETESLPAVNDGKDVVTEYKTEVRRVKKVYTVKSGDSLNAIANRLGCTVKELKSWNNLSSNTIHKGRQLKYYTNVKIKVPVKKKPLTT
jgi:membrane-bound lytic murein transglycosylase D